MDYEKIVSTLLDSPQLLREEAERYFWLAESLTNRKGDDSVMEYGRELLDRAERMEAALKGTEY